MKTTMKTFVRATGFALSAVMAFAQGAQATEAEALALLAEAQELYKQRADLTRNSMVIQKLTEALEKAEVNETKYDILVLKSRAHYFEGQKTSGNDAKMRIHELGYQAAQQAEAIDSLYAEAPYLYAINLGRWAEAKGILESLSRKDEMMDAANRAIGAMTREFSEGKTVDGYGPARTLGRMYFKLPGFAGGSRSRAVELLTEANTNAPDFALNAVYLAEALAAGNRAEKERARQILRDLIANPGRLNSSRAPENEDDLNLARALLRDLE